MTRLIALIGAALFALLSLLGASPAAEPAFAAPHGIGMLGRGWVTDIS
ncbi:MAG: hypothetical protein JNJ61_08885, partial [Anaerolineae bacterium]|nr:hypothetical protein [Anaerolineae bacterium]